MAAEFNLRPSLTKEMRTNDSWLDFTVGFRTERNTVEQSISFKDGKARVRSSVPAGADVTMIYKDDGVVRDMLRLPPNEVLNLLLKNRFRLEGNLSYMNLFNYYLSLLLGGTQKKMLAKSKAAAVELLARESRDLDPALASEMKERHKKRISATNVDEGVKFLDDPYLASYSLDDFPRLVKFLDVHMTRRPAICNERSSLLTDWFLENGFEVDGEGQPWVPELRQAKAYR